MSITALPFAMIGPERWDRFCAEASGAWFWHTSRWLAYQEARGGRNVSFGIMRDGEIMAACPLILECVAGRASLSMEGHPGPWPALGNRLSLANKEEVLERIGTSLGNGSAAGGLAAAAFRSCPLVSGCPVIPGFVSRVGWTSRVADLTLSETELHAGLRKSYHSLVNGGLRRMAFSWEPAPERVDQCMALHLAAAGRETRPPATWDMMRTWAKEGYGFPVLASLHGAPAAFAYFICDKGMAYYASGASLEPNLQHAILWKAILLFKEAGYRRLEIGWQGQAEDEKGKAIEFFKAGFGGEDVPIVVAERRFT